MNNNFYKQLIKESPTGYAYHRILCDEDGIACDYEFIEVNNAFEALTGLRGSDIVGRKITEVLPCIKKSKFDWIHFYGDIAINGGNKELEQFSEPMNKWYKVSVYSPEKYYFITHFADISKEIEQLTELESLRKIVKETEFKYKTIVDYAYDWETWEDSAGKLKYVSPACERISGYTVDEFVENESLLAHIIVEEDKEIWLNHRHRINNEKGAHVEQFRIRNRNGKVVWIEHSCRPVANKKGQYFGYRSNNRDITDRKIIEESLKKSEEKYRLLFENAVEAIVVIQNREIQICNPMAQRLTGYSEEELTSMPFLDLIYYEDLENIRDIHNLNLKEDSYNYKSINRLVRKDKEIRWIESNSIKINWNGKEAVLYFVIDINERKNAEEALRSNRRQLTDIIEFLPDATLAIDKERRVIIWNKVIEKMTGIPSAEMIGKGEYAYTIPLYGEAHSQLMDLVFPDYKEITTKFLNLTREGDTLMAEVFCPALNNKKGAWILVKASPLHDQAGNIIGAIESIRDITGLKQVEEKKRRYCQRTQREGTRASLSKRRERKTGSGVTHC